ncbi:hypothetical protein BABINDRAFT_163691 [Babjeviella inositovora NRRL Y-12698]|uniref:Uncharacterized protein n=1 Tax=Babjeviella inositovora NRRL Y-12698 TaxID=984486 RepID=A0A1E3QHR5_9ASCO|nr:uncharacterized protein BABINDRAFT_163691 [Babjeviella inositovora NRRL Y-12698]ODQ77180.1 hypothetical protein BABINDRAFT_163691 [Babjeviella inositovora NRRL Y-12698]
MNLGDDYLASTTRLSKAIATTASSLVQQSTQSRASLLQNPHYTQAMVSTLNGSRKVLLRLKTTSELLRGRFSTREQIYRATTELADELLQDLPDQKSAYSLFQGFNAVLPDIDDVIKEDTQDKTDGTQKAITDGQMNDPLPKGITHQKLKTCQNPKILASYQKQINYKLDLIEIRKGLAAAEIGEIDEKIQQLHEMRAVVLLRVQKFEKDETYLELQLEELADRISLVKDVEPASPEPEVETPRRKTKPTSQQYYESGSQITRFQAHEERITTFDFDVPFGTMCSAALDNTVRVWDLSQTKCIGLLEGHNAAVTSLQMDNHTAVTGSLDATLKLWDLRHMDEGESPMVHSFESHMDEVTALHFHHDTLVSGSADRTIRQWDMTTGHCMQTLDVLWVQSLAGFAPLSFIGALQCYDAALALGTADGVVRLWDLRSGEVVRELVGHTGSVTCLQFDSQHLASGSADRSIRIWDLRMGGLFDAFAYESPISSLQFDARRIVSTSSDSSVRIYDRVDQRHWSVGEEEASECVYARYKEGYLLEGRVDGSVGAWAV